MHTKIKDVWSINVAEFLASQNEDQESTVNYAIKFLHSLTNQQMNSHLTKVYKSFISSCQVIKPLSTSKIYVPLNKQVLKVFIYARKHKTINM